MDKFDVRCPDHFPMKCNLSLADKAYLITPEKYKAFFIFQYKDQDEWLEPTLNKYFNEWTWRLFNAGKGGGTGTKWCNVCRYALASDFAVASVTPLNHNVFQEIGMMQGLQKPVVYLVNPERKKEVPKEKFSFDIDDQIYVEHFNAKSLETGLSRVYCFRSYFSGNGAHILLNKIKRTLQKIFRRVGFLINQKYCFRG